METEKRFTGKFHKHVFQTIFLSYRPYGVQVLWVLALGFVARASVLSMTNVMGYWADQIGKKAGLGSHRKVEGIAKFFEGFEAKNFVAFLCILICFGFVTNTIFRVGISRIGTHAISRLYDQVTMRTSRYPMSFFDHTPVGRIVTRFSSDYSAVFRMAGGPMGEFLSIVFDLFLVVILVSLASPFFIPILLVTISLNAIVYKLNQQQLRDQRRELSLKRSPAIAHYSETAQGVASIRVYGQQYSFTSKFNQLSSLYLAQRLQTFKRVQLFSLQLALLTGLLLLCTGALGLFLVRSHLIGVGGVAVAFTFVMLTSATVQQFFEYMAMMDEAFTGVERMDEYLRKPLELGSQLPREGIFFNDPKIDTGLAEVFSPANNGKIQLFAPYQNEIFAVSNLKLRFSDNSPLILNSISFSLRPSERLGVIGRTGAGKSSLIQALFLLYPWEEGGWLHLEGAVPSIFKGNTSIRLPLQASNPHQTHTAWELNQQWPLQENSWIGLEEYRSKLSLIPQEPILYRGSLLENLLFSRIADDWQTKETSSFNQDKCENALKSVGLGPWLQSLGAKPWNYQIAERGSNLSAGQKQLLCMARCILQEAKLVIMDEATSFVDPSTEELIMQATLGILGNKPQIIVAHRLSTLKNCDRVLWLKGGMVFRIGSAAQVIEEFLSCNGKEI